MVKKSAKISFNVEIAKKAYLIYFFYASLALMLSLFLSYGPFWHRDAMNISSDAVFRLNHDTPLKPYEYISMLLQWLSLSLIYGIFAILQYIRLKKTKLVRAGYFVGAIVLGVAMFVVNWAIVGLSRIDCDPDCSADIPSYHAQYIMLGLYGIAAILLPALFLVTLYKLKAIPFGKDRPELNDSRNWRGH